MRDDAEGEEEEAESRCKLLASDYSYALQAVLALAALLSLLYKRQTESPRRPFLVWTMDVSKQGFGSIIIHFWNIALAVLFTELSTNVDDADECAFYFITFVIDTVLGVVLVWLLLKVRTCLGLLFGRRMVAHFIFASPVTGSARNSLLAAHSIPARKRVLWGPSVLWRVLRPDVGVFAHHCHRQGGPRGVGLRAPKSD